MLTKRELLAILAERETELAMAKIIISHLTVTPIADRLQAQVAERDGRIVALERQLADRKQFAAEYPHFSWTIGCVEHPVGWEYPCACEECLDPRNDI